MLRGHRIEASTREMIDEVLARGDIGPMLRRLLVETADDLDRALKCRELAPMTGRMNPVAGRSSGA